MKVYYDADLRELAEAAGFRGETLTTLSTNFKCTHNFWLESWEAWTDTCCPGLLSTAQKETATLISTQLSVIG